jgi:hypothetical protein
MLNGWKGTKKDKRKRKKMGTYKINFEVASERATVKEHMLLPPNDGQVKHPEHLQQHEMLQVLQRHALNGNVTKVKEMITELPEHQKKDTIEMIKSTVNSLGRTIDI